MKKKLFISAFALIAILSVSDFAYAQDGTFTNAPEKRFPPQEARRDFALNDNFRQLPPEFDKNKRDFNNNSPEFKNGHHQNNERKSEFENRLNLTDAQKRQIELNRRNDHEKMRPIMDNIKEKRHQFWDIDFNQNLSKAEKEQQKAKLKAEIKDLKNQANALREKNMKDFEKILTKEQKKEFNLIKKEQREKKKEMIKEIKKNDFPIMPPPAPFAERK